MKLPFACLAVLSLATTTFAAEIGRSSAPPEGVAPQAFEELYQLLRKNLPGVSEAELEQAAVKGLINQLYPLVSVVTNGRDASGPHATGSPSVTNEPPLAATSVLEGSFAYFRFNQITEGADKEFSTALKRIASTNRLRGLVLDLRFAEGSDYAAAAALADPFLPTRQPTLDWGEGLKHSTAKTEPGGPHASGLPVATLINNQTRGAAEAFAAILRRSDIGLVLGDNTAGQAFLTRDFTLKNGQRLGIATTPVKIVNGQPIPRNGLTPDIKVQVSLAEERAFLQDAYRPVPRFAAGSGTHASGLNGATNGLASTPGGTNTARRQRRPLNEAELVRMQREGIDFDSDFLPGRDAGPLRPPLITDPVLARALDLLKALALVQHSRTSNSR
jgi:hypothetical protein